MALQFQFIPPALFDVNGQINKIYQKMGLAVAGTHP